MRHLGFDPGPSYERPAVETAPPSWDQQLQQWFRQYGLIAILGLVGLVMVMGSGGRRR